ncbi:MAG: hypothetical protein H6592_06210 [Flavobacteriales bacterium]|nr:hypothetical protein [Flavobacteriales bacterium]
MSDITYRVDSLTREQQSRIDRLIESAIGSGAPVVLTEDATERFSQHYSQQLEQAKRLGKVDALLDAWEKGITIRFRPRLLLESTRVGGRSQIDRFGMDRLLEQCKRDKDDIL